MSNLLDYFLCLKNDPGGKDKQREDGKQLNEEQKKQQLESSSILHSKLESIYPFVQQALQSNQNFKNEEDMNYLKHHLLHGFASRNQNDRKQLLNFNDELFRAYCYLYHCQHHEDYKKIFSKWISTHPSEIPEEPLIYFKPLISSLLHLAEKSIQHTYLLFFTFDEWKDAPVQKSLWPSSIEMNELLNEISAIIIFYYWRGVENLSNMMEQIEIGLQTQDEKIWKEEQTKSLLASERIPQIKDPNDPLSAVRTLNVMNEKYSRVWHFLPGDSDELSQRQIYCHDAEHGNSGILFKYNAQRLDPQDVTLPERYIPIATHLFAQYWAEEYVESLYSSSSPLFPSIDSCSIRHIHLWLKQELQLEQSMGFDDKVLSILNEYHLPLGSRMYCKRSYIDLDSNMATDEIMNKMCGSAVATKLSQVLYGHYLYRYVADHPDHPLYDYLLMTKIDFFWLNQFPPHLQKKSTVMDENQQQTMNALDYIDTSMDDDPKNGIDDSFLNLFVIPNTQILENLYMFDAETQFESNESLIARGLNPEEQKDWATAKRLPLIIYLKKRWRIHYSKKWVGDYATFAEVFLCWLLIIKNSFAWVLPDRKYLKPVFESWIEGGGGGKRKGKGEEEKEKDYGEEPYLYRPARRRKNKTEEERMEDEDEDEEKKEERGKNKKRR